MNFVVTPIVVLMLTAFAIGGCSSNPELPDDSYNSADEQRSRAEQAQDELSTETYKKE
jgi:outer membrane lipoprotein SlyB